MKTARTLGLTAALWLAGCVVAPVSVRQPAVVQAGPPAVPPGMQYLYGSGEAAAADRQVWNVLVDRVAATVRARPRDSVVLADGASLAFPRFVPCADKPLAAVFDVDETVLLNRGFEYDAAFGHPWSDARWSSYERTGVTTAVAVPGAKAALDRLRALGVTVVFNTNRSAANAEATQVAIERNGLGPARHGETLFLKGDDAMGGRKDGRRWRIADRFCVVALGGDQLGDFSDLFNTGRAAPLRRGDVEAPAIARLWGAGWFVLPNPVYGTALQGTLDEVFPADAHWAPEP